MHLTIDLNLLRTFAVVYRERSITRAADALNVSQPAVSYALRRLRAHFDDPLFVRSGSGVRPTRVAVDLFADVSGPLAQLAHSAEDRAAFDPATSHARFRIALTDLGEAGLLPRILQAVSGATSGIRIGTVPLDVDTVAHDIVSRDIDAAIMSSAVPARVSQEVLFYDRYVALVPADVDGDDGTVRLEDLRALREVRVGASAGHRAIADAVSALGEGVLADEPRVEVHRFTALPWIVAGGGFFAIVPVDAFAYVTPADGVRLLDLPFPSGRAEVRLVSHRDGGTSAAHTWFLDTIRAALTRDAGDPAETRIR